MSREFSPKELARMRDRLADGVPRREVARGFGVSLHTLDLHCGPSRPRNFSAPRGTRRKGRELTDGEVEIIITLGRTGITIAEISEKTGLQDYLVSRTLHSNGVPVRSRNCRLPAPVIPSTDET